MWNSALRLFHVGLQSEIDILPQDVQGLIKKYKGKATNLTEIDSDFKQLFKEWNSYVDSFESQFKRDK